MSANAGALQAGRVHDPVGDDGARRPVGFVLAGGGTKGAFEAGALHYVAAEERLLPDVITSTSAGSVLGGVLAQAADVGELVACTEDLRTDLLAMTHTEVVFGSREWLEALDGNALGGAVHDFITLRTRPPVPGMPPAPRSRRDARRARVRKAASMLRGVPGALRALRTGRRDGFSSVLTLEPLGEALRGRDPDGGFAALDEDRVASSGRQLRMAVVALGTGVLRYVTEEGRIVEADATTAVPGGGRPGVLEGMLASSSVPFIFPPRRMGDDIYVDGGVVRIVPVDAAVALGARRLVAVTAVPFQGPPDRRDFTRSSMFSVQMRALGAISLLGRQIDDLRCGLPGDASLEIIDPTLDVVGPFEVAQGLMLIDMDYGWMRAGDTLACGENGDPGRLPGAPMAAPARATSDAVTAARVRAWHIEEPWWSGEPVTAEGLARLRTEKVAVRMALEERKAEGGPLPDGVERWFAGYEAHLGRRPDRLPEDPSAG